VPGNRVEALAGDRKRQHRIRVNQQYRITFRWEKYDAHDVCNRTTTDSVRRDASSPGPAVHPGEILLEEFLKPLEMAQAGAAKTLGMSTVRLNELVRSKRGVTADTLRLAQLFKTTNFDLKAAMVRRRALKLAKRA
jgi:addiction module HigA family antidote